MVLANISQSNLERAVEILISNGDLPQAQNAIAQVGYDPEMLQSGAALLDAWRDGLTQAQSLLTAQKRATEAEREARRIAGKEVSRLRRTVRVLFSHDETVLRSLGLRPPRRSNGTAGTNGVAANGNDHRNGNGTEAHAGYVSQATAATIVRWRRMLTNAQNLGETQQERLASASWDAERLAETAALVEAFAQADTSQQEAIQTYRAQLASVKMAERALRRWYKEARQLIRLAIEQTDPDDQEQLQELLAI